MKRTKVLLFVISLLVLPLSGFAQEGKVSGLEIRLGMGVFPERASALLVDGTELSLQLLTEDQDYMLSDVYRDYYSEVHSTNCLGTDVLFHASSRWDVGCGLYFNHLWYDYISGVTGQKLDRHHGDAVYVIPTFRRYYLSNDMVRVYGQFSIGFAKYFSFDKLKYTYYDLSGDFKRVDNSLSIAAEIVPFGIEIGRDWFGFAEVGYGGLYRGICVGGGYKF
ncbi:MAG: hypothetical protein Q4G10_04935 [Bacteroidia bacterium]|nr:hypothetical protein [Bacteroidia bacterium]